MLSRPQWLRVPLAMALDVEGRRRDIVACVEAASIDVFGAGMDLERRLDVRKARLPRVASIADDPVDNAGSRIGARFDAAMAFLDGGFGDGLGGGSGTEIILDIGFEGGLIALEGEQVVGLVGDDFVGDLDLAAHGVDGHERAFELLGLRELIEKIGNGGDLVGLFRHAKLRQDQPCIGGVGAERMQGLEPLAPVVGTARRLAVDRNELMPVRPQRRHPILKAAPEQDRIDPIDEAAHPALAGNPVMELRKPPQKREMVPAPGDDIVEIVARRDGGAGHQQQDLM